MKEFPSQHRLESSGHVLLLKPWHIPSSTRFSFLDKMKEMQAKNKDTLTTEEVEMTKTNHLKDHRNDEEYDFKTMG